MLARGDFLVDGTLSTGTGIYLIFCVANFELLSDKFSLFWTLNNQSRQVVNFKRKGYWDLKSLQEL